MNVKVWHIMQKLRTGVSGERLQSPGWRNRSYMRVPKRKNIGKHRKTSEYIKQVQDIRDKEMDETPTGVSRSWWEPTGLDGRWLEEVWKGPDRRYPETVLELLGSNNRTRCGSSDQDDKWRIITTHRIQWKPMWVVRTHTTRTGRWTLRHRKEDW